MSLLPTFSDRGEIAQALGAVLNRWRLSSAVRDLEDAIEAERGDRRHARDLVELRDSSLPIAFHPSRVEAAAAVRFLGPLRLAFSGFWSKRWNTLAAAEVRMLELVSERAEVGSARQVLNVSPFASGLPLWMEEAHPGCVVTELSLSELRSRTRENHDGLRFDLVLALQALPEDASIRDLTACLQPGGQLFIQSACHRARRHTAWSGTGQRQADTVVPAASLRLPEPAALSVVGHWEQSGEHYEKSLLAWAEHLRANVSQIVEHLRPAIGIPEAERRVRQWQLALRSTAAMYGLHRGQEWWISQHLLATPSEDAQPAPPTGGLS